MNLPSLQILDVYNLNATEKREVLIVILQIVRNLDDASVVKAWQQSIARTRLFFKLMEECLVLFEVAIQLKFNFLFIVQIFLLVLLIYLFR